MSGGLLVVNGSPHLAGNGMVLARVLAGCLRCGVDVVDLYPMGLGVCGGCGGCGVGGGSGCVVEDGFAGVMGRVALAEYVVMVSPLHFSGLSAPLVGFVSRFQVYWGKDVSGLFGGVGGLIVTGGARYRGMFVGPRKMAAAAYRTLGMRFAGLTAVANTDKVPAAENAGALARVERLAGRMAAMRT